MKLNLCLHTMGGGGQVKSSRNYLTSTLDFVGKVPTAFHYCFCNREIAAPDVSTPPPSHTDTYSRTEWYYGIQRGSQENFLIPLLVVFRVSSSLVRPGSPSETLIDT